MRIPKVPRTPGRTRANDSNTTRTRLLVCEDSKVALPTAKAVAEHYATAYPNKLAVRLHMFPLAYNIGSFLAAQVGRVQRLQ